MSFKVSPDTNLRLNFTSLFDAVQNLSVTGPIERESLALFKRKKRCSPVQRSTLKALSMDCCCKVGLPALLLWKLLAQYFEKEIYFGMCTFHHKPFLVKPQGFLRLTAKTQEKFYRFKEIQTLQYKHAQLWFTKQLWLRYSLAFWNNWYSCGSRWNIPIFKDCIFLFSYLSWFHCI